MKAGGRAFMVIPSELAFKAVDNSSIGVPRFSTLLANVYVKSGLSPYKQAQE
jgi:FKBP-type peptidyl-prolyl cis-trans isomerase